MGKLYISLQVIRSRQLVSLERYGFHLETGLRGSQLHGAHHPTDERQSHSLPTVSYFFSFPWDM